MKKVFRNNRLILIAFFTIFSVAAVSIARAADKNPELPVELKYIGKIGNRPMFELNINGNQPEDQFIITVKDEDDISLYTENIKGEVFSKKFLLNTDELGYTPVKFEIFSKKTRKTVVFQITRNRHYVDEMMITTLK
ncbi:MAG TPA: hypothetical protein VET23_02450 [Chitinophagaceae bacterium]|nr:hypothetical protein [Chitinophagaceae bacterium]